MKPQTMKHQTMKPKETSAFVDEIDGEVARLIIGEHAFTVPRMLLPRDAAEGKWVRIAIGVISAPPDDADAKRKKLAGRDPGGDIEL